MKAPNFAACLNRMHDGHAAALRAMAAGTPILRSNATPGEYRGARTIVMTLARWEAAFHGKLTDKGIALLAAWDAQRMKAKP